MLAIWIVFSLLLLMHFEQKSVFIFQVFSQNRFIERKLCFSTGFLEEKPNVLRHPLYAMSHHFLSASRVVLLTIILAKTEK